MRENKRFRSLHELKYSSSHHGGLRQLLSGKTKPGRRAKSLRGAAHFESCGRAGREEVGMRVSFPRMLDETGPVGGSQLLRYAAPSRADLFVAANRLQIKDMYECY